VAESSTDALKNTEMKNVINEIIEIAKNSQEKRSDVTIPKSLHELLMSNEIYTALFLSTDWTEAGLSLWNEEQVSDVLPEWFTLQLVQALNKNRGTEHALNFAAKQSATPSLKLLIAELLIADNQMDKALQALKEIDSADSDIGSRAAWLVSLIYIGKKDYQNAKEVVSNNHKFSQSILGQETLGRIAVYENDHATAESIYSSIESNSAEARSYLAKKAYADKNWPKARELTERLIKEFPENEVLKDNLKRIVTEQNKQKKVQ
jgi:tetratricopeptide (TPR) repeat protein